MTTTAEPRVLEVIDTSVSSNDEEMLEELPEPIEDIRPDIGSLIDQWRIESTIEAVDDPIHEFTEEIPEEVKNESHAEEDEDFVLPDWAIEPSPNMSDDVVLEIEEKIEIETYSQEEIEVSSVSSNTSVSRPKKKVARKVKRTGPRAATVDHKPKARVRNKSPPLDHSIRADGLRDAAERWHDIVESRNQETQFEAIPKTGKDIPEFIGVQSKSNDASADILRNAREIDDVWLPKGLEDARRHEIVHTTSRHSSESEVVREPPSSAREFASAKHRQRRDFSVPRTATMDTTELPEDFYERLAILVEKGGNIGEIMASVERSPSEALKKLEQLEGKK
tara:strand:- start:406 stop:1413 length:1008 start_codon:yes stop_codon:yes gene_type:complete